MDDQQLLFAGGVFTAGFAVFHLAFWKLFHWRSQLVRLNRVNRAIMQVLNLSLTFVFALVAWLSIYYAGELTTTPLGRALTAGIALMWGLRAIEQLVFFQTSRPASIAFFMLFVLGAGLYAIPLLT